MRSFVSIFLVHQLKFHWVLNDEYILDVLGGLAVTNIGTKLGGPVRFRLDFR